MLYRNPLSHFLAAAVLLLAGVAPLQAQEKREDLSWIDQRVERWQPKAEERRFDELGWAPDLRTALRLGREHRRPVFLFTHDGRMNVGRC